MVLHLDRFHFFSVRRMIIVDKIENYLVSVEEDFKDAKSESETSGRLIITAPQFAQNFQPGLRSSSQPEHFSIFFGIFLFLFLKIHET